VVEVSETRKARGVRIANNGYWVVVHLEGGGRHVIAFEYFLWAFKELGYEGAVRQYLRHVKDYLRLLYGVPKEEAERVTEELRRLLLPSAAGAR